METKILDLPLKAKWFEMIESGIKKEEYRIIKPYWCRRFSACRALCWMRDANGECRFRYGNRLNIRNYTHIRFRYAYTQRSMLFVFNGIQIGKGKPEWGAPDKDVFILSIGERIIEKKNDIDNMDSKR